MPDYQKCVIYKIVNEPETFCYVGHTVNLSNRRRHHIYSCNNESRKSYNFNLYKTIRENGGWDKFKMVVIESYPCETHQEAIQREQYYISQLKSNMNGMNSYTDRKEYNKQYNELNKERVLEQRKQYRESNKDKIAQQWKNYYEDNKERISDKRKETFECECGSFVTVKSKQRHFRTKKHRDFIFHTANAE